MAITGRNQNASGSDPACLACLLGNLSEDGDSVGGQLLRGDKREPFQWRKYVTSFGRVWRNVPENDAQNVPLQWRKYVTNSGRVWRKVPENDTQNVPLQCRKCVTNSGRVWRKVPENDTQNVPLQCRKCVTNFGRVWRKVPENDAQNVPLQWRKYVTNFGRVWREVPETDAQNVPLQWHTNNQFWHSLEEGAGKRRFESGEFNRPTLLTLDLKQALIKQTATVSCLSVFRVHDD